MKNFWKWTFILASDPAKLEGVRSIHLSVNFPQTFNWYILYVLTKQELKLTNCKCSLAGAKLLTFQQIRTLLGAKTDFSNFAGEHLFRWNIIGKGMRFGDRAGSIFLVPLSKVASLTITNGKTLKRYMLFKI